MNRFWEILIYPILEELDIRNVVEIGAQKGLHTKKILDYCIRKDAVLYTVDPLRIEEYEAWEKEHPENFSYIEELSLNALSKITEYDAVFLDGDHNWYTVYHELKMIEKTFSKGNFPLIFAHDIGWPYGRRDLYYDPENIPAHYRQAHKKGGIRLDSSQLVKDKGFNAHLHNSVYENTPKNGVKTGIEDFLNESEFDLVFEEVHGFHGLGILYEKTQKNMLIENVLESKKVHENIAEKLEKERLSYLVKTLNLKQKLEALEVVEIDNSQSNSEFEALENKANELLKQVNNKSDEIEQLNAQLSVLKEENDTHKDAQEKYSNLQRKVERLEKEFRKQSKKLELVYSSIKYQLGDILVSSLKSPKKFILLPYTVAKLVRRAYIRKKRRPAKKNNKSEKNPFKNLSDSVFYKTVNDICDSENETNFKRLIERSENELKKNIYNLKNEPLISIIMPTYNRGDVLDQSIKSVLEQSYTNWELLICDDGSTDNTEKTIAKYMDSRIRYFKLPWGGAAKARNHGLENAKGEYIAYLDTDNIWHPQYLLANLTKLIDNPGYYSIFNRYIDVYFHDNNYRVKTCKSLTFDYDNLMEKNFIDLNSFVHKRELYDHFGGFNEELPRRQDWDLVLKYTFLRDPLYIDQLLVIYRRNKEWNQISHVHSDDTSSQETIKSSLESYFKNGLPDKKNQESLPKITIISWDVSRNHFSKAYNIAESLSKTYTVQLLGFRFFEEEIFPPYKHETPDFKMTIFEGANFPDLFKMMSDALKQIDGDIIYAVKPRLTSLGLALLANYHLEKPIILEYNDLETVVSNPQKDKLVEKGKESTSMNFKDEELLTPYSLKWSTIVEKLSKDVPVTTTHNKTLDQYFGGNSFYIRNLKDEKHYDPNIYDRNKLRDELGFEKDDRIILFGGLVRKHKGIYELVKLLDKLDDDRYKLLFVGSRVTPDQKKLIEQYGDKIKVLPPQGRNEMAKINYASDLVILWLDPNIAASHYQMPYKFTDAIAMKVPVISNDISDLGDLSRQGYLRHADFGDFNQLKVVIKDIFNNEAETDKMVKKARNLYIRQFSYNAVKSNLNVIFDIAKKHNYKLQASKDFVDLFSEFYENTSKNEERSE
ncbi:MULTISPECIES: glycosyltransferase [Paraliobacillus]|uniref:glycosyltransferase n=1 Tax=Paraliobacillus TaxID=200903 RepID=UPI000DD3C03A|nr:MULTISPECIES: glycosyltransferase [Paraliobacillus]